MRIRIRDRPFLLVWGAIILILLGNLGAAPLTDVDEGAFSEATREMWARKDFISPWLLDHPRFDKPVLIHWAQLASMLIFGFNSFGARLPSAIAGFFWILAIASWAKVVAEQLGNGINPGRAFQWAVVIAATCIAVPAMSRSATADALLNALMSWSLYFIYRGLLAPNRKEALAMTRRAAVCVGLGLLTKGPIAVLIPFVAFLTGIVAFSYQSMLVRIRDLLLDPWSWIWIMIPLPWYWLQYQAQGDAFLQGFLGVHNIGRFTKTMHNFSAGPWYYPLWMFIALLPLSTFIARCFFGLKRYSFLIARPMWVCWGNFLFVIIFFSLSATKLPHYGFYGLPGLIILLALWAANKRWGVNLLIPRL